MEGGGMLRSLVRSPGLMAGGLLFPFIIFGAVWWGGLEPGAGWSEVTATSRTLPAGDAIELTYRSEGDTWTDTIPIHRAGPVRYFSAGVGMAERAVEYPPFSLKIVLTAGGKPFLAHVNMQIIRANGTPLIAIPADHVNGPWLFVDLPAGTYDITGDKEGSTTKLRGVTVKPGSMQTVYLRFSEEAGR